MPVEWKGKVGTLGIVSMEWEEGICAYVMHHTRWIDSWWSKSHQLDGRAAVVVDLVLRPFDGRGDMLNLTPMGHETHWMGVMPQLDIGHHAHLMQGGQRACAFVLSIESVGWEGSHGWGSHLFNGRGVPHMLGVVPI
jgi:hypothetical protein